MSKRTRAAAVLGVAAAAAAGNLTAATAQAAPAAPLTAHDDASLATAVSQASAGQTVTVAAGVYHQALTVTRPGVTIAAAQAGAATFTSTVTVAAAGTTLTGINVSGSTGYGLDVKAPNTHVTGGHFDNNARDGVYIEPSAAGTVVDGVEASGNGAGSSTTGPTGIDVLGANVRVLNSVLHGNAGSGLQFYIASEGKSGKPVQAGGDNGYAANNVSYGNGDHGIDDLIVSNVTLVNNTVYDNCNSGINAEGTSIPVSATNPTAVQSGPFTIVNNISFDNSDRNHPNPVCRQFNQQGELRVADGAVIGTRADHNLVFSDWGTAAGSNVPMYRWGPSMANVNYYSNSSPSFQAATGQGAGDVIAGPGVVDAAAADFHLAAGAAAAGRGTTGPFVPATDAGGANRPTPPSIGAFDAGGAPPPPPGSGMPVNRLGGADRYGTGVLVSQHKWAAGSANAVVLAFGGNFPDALAGVPLAAKKGGPLLLAPANPADPAFTAEVAPEIARVLGNSPGKTVYLLGGGNALSAGYEQAITGLGYHVYRFAGVDRYDTAYKIATDADGMAVHAGSHLVVATGAGFADALSAGPLAAGPFAAGGSPAAVVLSQDKVLDPQTRGLVAAAGAGNVAAVGGQAVAAVQSALPGATHLFAGADRYETAEKVATQGGFAAAAQIGVASGAGYPDALTGGAYQAEIAGPIVLTEPKLLPAFTITALGIFTKAGEADVYGGPVAVSTAVYDQIAATLGGHPTSGQ